MYLSIKFFLWRRERLFPWYWKIDRVIVCVEVEIKWKIVNGFLEYCLVPFLYAISLKRQYDIDFIFGELAHGDDGLVDEYSKVFNVDSEKKVKKVLKMLSLRKRVANKKSCPCECGNRLGKCTLRFRVNEYRKLAHRSWYSSLLK